MACVQKIVCENILFDIAISPDGRILAMAIRGSDVQLYTCSGEPLGRLDEERYSALSTAFSPAGSPLLLLAISASDGYVRVYDCINRVRVAKLQSRSSESTYATTFSPNGHLLAAASMDGIVQLWHTDDWNAPPTVLADAVHWPSHVTFSCDSRVFVSCASSDRLNLWTILDDNVIEATYLQNVQTMPQDGNGNSPLCIEFSPVESKLLACGGKTGRLVLTRLGNNAMTIEHTLQGHTKSVYCVAFSPCGKQLASTSFDTTVRLWSVASGTCLRVLREQMDRNYNITFFPNGKQLAISSFDRSIRIWTVCAWRDFTHQLFGAKLKAAVFTMMCVRARLEQVLAQQLQVLAQQLQVPARQEQVLVPRLPMEVWLLVFEQLARAQNN